MQRLGRVPLHRCLALSVLRVSLRVLAEGKVALARVDRLYVKYASHINVLHLDVTLFG